MRAREFIVEYAVTNRPRDVGDAMTGFVKARDREGGDRHYHYNRIMMAVACADGSDKKLDVPDSSWAEKYNTYHPYSEVEVNMIKQALKTIPSIGEELVSDHRSYEPQDTYTTSPVLASKKSKMWNNR